MSGRDLTFQAMGKLFSELRHLWPYYELTVSLERVSSKIFLVVGFRLVPSYRRNNLRHNGISVQLFVSHAFHDLLSDLVLRRATVKDR